MKLSDVPEDAQRIFTSVSALCRQPLDVKKTKNGYQTVTTSGEKFALERSELPHHFNAQVLDGRRVKDSLATISSRAGQACHDLIKRNCGR